MLQKYLFFKYLYRIILSRYSLELSCIDLLVTSIQSATQHLSYEVSSVGNILCSNNTIFLNEIE